MFVGKKRLSSFQLTGGQILYLPSDRMLGVKICCRVAASPPVSRLDGGGADGASFEAVEGGEGAEFTLVLLRL